MSSVSVVIPTYNDADVLTRAIGSALAQTSSVDEIIIVDDASTDDPRTVVEQFDDDRIRYIKHTRNKGGSAARNTGIKSATGDYIAFLDADDEWRPRKIERQLAELQSRSDDWVAVHCGRKRNMGLADKIGYRLSQVIGIRKGDLRKEGGEELIKDVLLTNLSTGASTLLVRSDIVEDIGGFDPEFPRHQDWEFLIRILKRGKLAYVDEPLVIKHGTGRPAAEVHEEAKELLLATFRSEIETLEEKGYSITHRQRLHLAKLYFEDGEFSTGWGKLPDTALTIPQVLSLLWSLSFGLRNWVTQRV